MDSKDKILLINRICDEFESELKLGRSPEIEAYLESSVYKEQEFLESLVLELIELKILYSPNRDETAELLRSKFP